MAEGKRTLQIVSPCPAAWEEMRGTADKRHCDHCNKAVHNLSEMEPEAAAELLERKDPICVRVRCSADGTVLHGARPEKSAGRARLQLLVTPTLLAAMAACQTPADDLPLVVEGPHASASPAPVVAPPAPASAPAVEQSEPVASAKLPVRRELQPPTPGYYLTGATAAPHAQPGPIAPEPVQAKPRPAKAPRVGGPKARGAVTHSEHPRPDWLMERDRQPRPERDSEFECMGFCM
ncbi:MAG TPA: hypothetical protein VFS67_25825 [Polyangiaceae bacterium]|jgi:hypothetical protein|nr:hypothetical protein [Polyangiaceae bacterium]